MPYIPNPDKPGELSTIAEGISAFYECCTEGGGVNLEKFAKWKSRYPAAMWEAYETLNMVLDEHYPPVEQGGVQHDQRSSDRIHDYRSA